MKRYKITAKDITDQDMVWNLEGQHFGYNLDGDYSFQLHPAYPRDLDNELFRAKHTANKRVNIETITLIEVS